MLRGSLLFFALLACGLLTAEGSRMLRFSTGNPFKTGVESTASAAAFPTVKIPTATHTLSEAIALIQQKEVPPEILPIGGKNATRTTTTTSTSRTLVTSSKAHKRRENFVPFNRPKTKEKDINKKQFSLASSVQMKTNSSFTPEHNSLITTEKQKHSVKRKSTGESRKNFKRPSRRRVTKEVREFWDTLDPRHRPPIFLQTDQSRAANDGFAGSNILNRSDNTSVLQNKSVSINDTVFEDFPFLSENYDYNYYYYYEDPLLTTYSSTSLPELNSYLEGDQNNTETSFTRNKGSIKASEHPEQNNKNINNDTDLPLNFKQKLSTKLLPILKLQGRNMPMITAEGTSHIPIFSLPPSSTVPMSAIDSFRNRRQNDNDRNNNRPIDILKEFPIFRHFERDVSTANKRTLSLHERLQNHLTSPVPTTTTVFTLPPASTTISTTTAVIKKTTAAVKTTTTTNSTPTLEDGAIFAIESADTVQKQVTTEMTSIHVQSADQSKTANDTIDVEAIQRNVTFSTSKSHKIVETSQINPPQALVFESQLGFAPLGERPFGISPFGETPMGQEPFGLLPEGQSPLGNVTVSLNATMNGTDANIPQEGVDGRYHVQVTGPDGSINGDYIVVDPVTGDVNGVRYEAAHDVDPLLVQRALLSFLSLDPRLSSVSSGNPITADTSTVAAQLPPQLPSAAEEVTTEQQVNPTVTMPVTQLPNPTEPTESILL